MTNNTEINAAPTLFEDGKGRRWRPVLTVPAIMKTCRSCGITISTLMDLSINVADLLDAIWFACEYQAKEFKLDRETFFEEVLTVQILPDAVAAMWTAMQTAFPQMKNVAMPKAGDKADLPFGLGR